MLNKKFKTSALQSAALIFIFIFIFAVGACLDGLTPQIVMPADDDQNTDTGTGIKFISEEAVNVTFENDGSQKNYVTGADAKNWGSQTTNPPEKLGLSPGSTTKEIRLSWNSSAAVKDPKVRIVEGTFTEGYGIVEVAGKPTQGQTQIKAAVNGLEPGKSYQYAVSTDGVNWSEKYNIKIPAATGAFKFGVITDPQITDSTVDSASRYKPSAKTVAADGAQAAGETTTAGWMETMKALVDNGVSFIASCGDQVNNNGGTDVLWTNFFTPPGLRTLPFSSVVGNNDMTLKHAYHFNVPNELKFTETLSISTMGNYFYLYNNILFVCLNTGGVNPTSRSSGATAVSRYKTTMQAALTKFPKESSGWDWLIVQHHKSTASVAEHLADKDIQFLVEGGFESLMSEYNVDFVLAGHDHVYARSYPLEGLGEGKVSVPDKNKGEDLILDGKTYTKGSYTSAPGNPIFLTFNTSSGIKYYQVRPDPYDKWNNASVKLNTNYPYLGDVTNGGEGSSAKGSAAYLTGEYLPVSNAVFVQAYIPSYTIVEVDGKTITFKTYPIDGAGGTTSGASKPYKFDKGVPYDVVTVTKN